MSVPPSLARPRVATGATAYTAVLVLAERLAQAQEDDRALVLGLKADEQHGPGGLEVGVGDRAAVGAGGHDGEARKSASSAECGRARKSMSLVPSTVRANLP